MKLFLITLIAASLVAIAVNEVTAEKGAPVETTGIAHVDTPKGDVFLSLDADGRAVILTGELAQAEKRGTLNYYSPSHRVESRLRELRELNDKLTPKPPPAPSTVVIVNQTTNVEIERERRGHRRSDMRVDRRIHSRRQRTARQAYPTPLPGITGLGPRAER